ncbi:MAG: gliding motility-associated C-terminal domain-containing protein, partial [Chitinophagaceae bacterium]|nr:gliding motility-associated C-terminal domain-containing protein [Chitinophagaceae bacterium]
GLCQSVVASALTATGTNLQWYTVPTGGTGSSTLIPSTSSPGVTRYYVSQTVNGCESSRDTATVIITAKPSNPTVTSNQGFCQNAVVGPLSATGTNIKWYVVPTGGAPLTNPPTPSTSTPGNTVFFVSQTSSTTGCESDRVPVTVTIYATPAPPAITSPINYCVGGPATPSIASQVAGSNLKWYTVPTGGIGSSTAPVANTSTATIDTYYVSQTQNTCEGPRGMIIVNVIANPAPPQTNNVTYCQFGIAGPLAANGQNLLWYAAATGGTGKTVAPVPSTSVAGTFKYYVSQTVNGCESERDSIVVTVNPKPQPPVGNDDSVCQYSVPVPLSGTGSNLLWYLAPTGGIGISIPPSPVTSTPGTFYWYVSQTLLGCESDRDTVEIEVVQLPDAPVADSAEYCLNGVAQPVTATGQDLKWYTVPFGGTPLATAPTPTTSSIGYIRYYVSQTMFGCESPRDTAVVKVDTLVTVNIYVSDKFFCLTDSVEIGQTGVMPDTGMFTWTWDGGNVLSGDTSGPYILKWNTPGKKTITLNAEDNGCRASDTSTLEVLPLPEAWFNMPDEICPGKELEVTTVDSFLKYAYGYNWTIEGASDIVRSDSTGFVTYWDKPGIYSVKLRTISDSGCMSPMFADTITVREEPKAKILPLEYTTICTKTGVNLKAEVLQGFHKYEWSPAEYFLINKSTDVIATIPSSGYIRLSVTDDFGCTGNDSVYVGIKLCCKAVLPSAFSPNNDGRNDQFGIISSGNYRISSFRIVNRYGDEVFSTRNQRDRWDGTYNGQPQGIGTYYYYIKYSCEDDDADNEVEERGDVTLIR